jgi:hypothetical protein
MDKNAKNLIQILFLLLIMCLITIVVMVHMGEFSLEKLENITFVKTYLDRRKAIEVDPDLVIIKLRNRGEIKGVIRWENEEGILLDVGYGTAVISRRDIENIRKPPAKRK